VSEDPYSDKNINVDDVYKKRREVKGELIALMDLKLQNRNLKLIEPSSRAIKKTDIHELVITSENPFENEMTVDKVVCIGFIEIHKGGVIIRNDNIKINDNKIGKLLGFDTTHAPNHLNLVVFNDEPKTGYEYEFKIGNQVIIS